ncbi:hypothetical protein QJQ45_030478, partial [Haematococcus lacustris]
MEIDTDARNQLVQSASNQQVQQVQQRFATLSTVPQQNVAAHGAQAAEQPNVAALGAPSTQQPNNAALGAGQQNGAANVPLFSFTPVSVPTAPSAPQPQPHAQPQPQPVQQLAQVVAAAGPGEAKTAAINAFTTSAQQLLNAAERLHAVEPELTETLLLHTTDDLRKVVGVKPSLLAMRRACQCRMMAATSRMWMAAGVKWVVSLRSSAMSQRLSPPTLQPTLQPTLPAQLSHSMSQRRTMQGVPGVHVSTGTTRTQHRRPWGVAGGVVASLQDQRQAGGCHRAEAGAVDTRARLPGSQLRLGLWQQPLSISQSFARAVAIHSQSASALTRLVTRILPGIEMDVSYQVLSRANCRTHWCMRYTLREMNEIKKQVAELLAKKLTEPSCSPYGAPVLFVEKRDGTLRMCVDYRALNKLTVRDRYPLPRIDDLFDKLQGKTIFSSLDLQSGYHQIRITPEDVPKTAFVTPEGQFQYKVLSFGLTNAPATLQRVMSRVFEKQLKEGFVLVYLDDILVMSSSPEEHAMHLKEVLQVMKDNQLYAKLSKCDFNR